MVDDLIVRMSIATVGTHLIHYEVVGRGEPLIFVHGWLGSWRYWWPAMQSLSTMRRTFAFDLWGFGDSSKQKGQPTMYSLRTYVGMLEQFIEKLGITTPLTLVGHALGGAVALRFANQHPEQVKRLVMVSLPVEGRLMNERLRTMSAGTFLQKYLSKTTYPEVELETRKTDPGAVSQSAVELSGESFLGDLEHVACQSLLVFGEQDQVVQLPLGDYAFLQRPTSNRYYISLAGCTHFPMLEEAAKFNRLIMDFIHTDNHTEIAPKELWHRRTR